MSIHWQLLRGLPEGFFTLKADEILSIFPQPTLVVLPGQKPQALFVSILLHGHEVTGLAVMQQLLQDYQHQALPRTLLLFIGNVQAAAQSMRRLSHELDWNRIWRGTDHQGPLVDMMAEVFAEVCGYPLFAAVDIHNNTGSNPLYGCISQINGPNRYLASLFNHVALYIRQPRGTATMAFDGVCPAITLEAGRPGEVRGIGKSVELLQALLHLESFPQKEILPQDLQLLETHLTLKIPNQVSFSFGGDPSAVDLWFPVDFDHVNFSELPEGSLFAKSNHAHHLVALNSMGQDVTAEVFIWQNGNLFLQGSWIPAMISLDEKIVRQDCLCYLLKDYQGA